MKKHAVVALGVCLASLVIVTWAGAGQSAKKDQASADGVRAPSCDGCPNINFSIDATSGPAGENPAGNFSVNIIGDASFRGHVTCLNVTGNRAVIEGVMDAGTGAEAGPGGDFLVVLWDNGHTKAGPSPDRMGLVIWGNLNDVYPPYTAAQVCADPSLVAPLDQFALLSGNIKVKDARNRRA